MKILLIGDEPRMRRLLAFGLAPSSDQPVIISSLAELGRLPGLRDYHAALLDWEMRGDDAAETLRHLRRLAPLLPVIALTASVSRERTALDAGATATLAKPIDIDEAQAVLARHARSCATPAPAATALVFPENPASTGLTTAPLPTRSPLLLRQLSVASKIASRPVSVLLLGENGTGKTHFARHIHDQSNRREKSFITVNCPCLQTHLLESELFGHVRGAFTSAVADSSGLVAAAEGGTLFLDEIGELPLALQPKLLRLLQERCYERVGEARTRRADIRIIAATNRDLRAEVAAGRFREDLFYRLNVISLELPQLRQRPEDIMPTAESLLEEFARAAGRSLRGFSPQASVALQRHSWPGNIRELRNCIERAALLCEGDIVGISDLPELGQPSVAADPQVGDFVTLAALQQAHIQRVIERTDTLSHAARLLGIDPATLYRHRRRHSDETTVPFDQALCSA